MQSVIHLPLMEPRPPIHPRRPSALREKTAATAAATVRVKLLLDPTTSMKNPKKLSMVAATETTSYQELSSSRKASRITTIPKASL